MIVQENTFDWNTTDHRMLAMSLCMTGSDLNSSSKPWATQRKANWWTIGGQIFLPNIFRWRTWCTRSSTSRATWRSCWGGNPSLCLTETTTQSWPPCRSGPSAPCFSAPEYYLEFLNFDIDNMSN